MNEQSPIREPKVLDRRAARRQRRAERFADPSRGGAWGMGLILIVLGGIFLLNNTGTFDIPFENWWALFILIPAIGAFARAYRIYQQADNQWTARARGSLFTGLILTILSGLFLFNIDLTFYGPLLLILAGIGILANGMVGKGGT